MRQVENHMETLIVSHFLILAPVSHGHETKLVICRAPNSGAWALSEIRYITSQETSRVNFIATSCRKGA